MPSPFPGMNPYLENPALWSGVHHWLINAIARSLGPQLRPKYIVAVEERIYETSGEESVLVGIPDDVVVQSSSTAPPLTQSNVAIAPPATQPITVIIPMPETIRQGYLEVRKVGTEEVITAIELLSPINKKSGTGRQKYETKRQKILGSFTNLIEIDLLRQGNPMPICSNGIHSHYRILVSRSDTRPKADLYVFNLQDVIPSFPIPLPSEEREPLLDLQKLLNEIYDLGSYDLRLDYNREPVPSLSKTDAAWADRLLVEKGLRS